MTFRPGICASMLIISSARPSLKYSFSLSALIFANGRTAIEGTRSSGLFETCPKAAFSSDIV